MLFVAAIAGATLYWMSNKLSKEHATWGSAHAARVLSVSKTHTDCQLWLFCTSWRLAEVEVHIKHGHTLNYEEIELENSAHRGQHIRTWLRNGDTNYIFFEKEREGSGSAEFAKVPWRGNSVVILATCALSFFALAFGLMVLRLAKKHADKESGRTDEKNEENEEYLGPSFKGTAIGAINVLNVIAIVGLIASGAARKKVFHIYGAVTFTDVAYAVAGIVVVMSLFLGLSKLAPWLKWSWTQYLGEKHAGSNLTTFTMKIPWVGPIYTAMLFMGLPLLAKVEEEWFRGGTHGWWQGVLRSFMFGMAHCLVGVPLAAGIAISVFGLWLTQNYFWGGVHQSTEVHTAYNAILVALFCVGFVAFKILSRPRSEEATT